MEFVHMQDIYSKAAQVVALHNTLYSLLYDGKIKCTGDAVEQGDKWICDNSGSDFFRAILNIRGDIFSSDREVAALALALEL